MKTYTEVQRIKEGYTSAKNPNVWGRWGEVIESYTHTSCWCIRATPISSTSFMWAYEDCTNCFGRGIPPIPWSELK